MHFLRGDGLDISLDDLINNAVVDEDSSASSDATSENIEEKARFLAAHQHCPNTLFNRKGLPNDVFTRASMPATTTNPIMIDRSILVSAALDVLEAKTGWDIVPWCRCFE